MRRLSRQRLDPGGGVATHSARHHGGASDQRLRILEFPDNPVPGAAADRGFFRKRPTRRVADGGLAISKLCVAHVASRRASCITRNRRLPQAVGQIAASGGADRTGGCGPGHRLGPQGRAAQRRHQGAAERTAEVTRRRRPRAIPLAAAVRQPVLRRQRRHQRRSACPRTTTQRASRRRGRQRQRKQLPRPVTNVPRRGHTAIELPTRQIGALRQRTHRRVLRSHRPVDDRQSVAPAGVCRG